MCGHHCRIPGVFYFRATVINVINMIFLFISAGNMFVEKCLKIVHCCLIIIFHVNDLDQVCFCSNSRFFSTFMSLFFKESDMQNNAKHIIRYTKEYV